MNKNILNKLTVSMFIAFTALTFWNTITTNYIACEDCSSILIEEIQPRHDETIQYRVSF